MSRGFDTRPPVSPEVKETVMAGLVRNEDCLLAARKILKAEHFSEYEAHWSVLWSAVSDYYEEHHALPKGRMLWIDIKERLKEDREALSDQQRDTLHKFLRRTYKTKSDEYDPSWVSNKLGDMIADHLATTLRESVADLETPQDLPKLLQDFSVEVQHIAELGPVHVEGFAPDGWEGPKSTITIPTGIVCIDEMLCDGEHGNQRGGHSPGECLGFLAPFGSCKTTAVIQIAVEGARYQKADWESRGRTGSLGLWFYFFYEHSIDVMRARCMCYAAQINRTRVESMNHFGGVSYLSDSDNLLPYEQHLFKGQLSQGLEVEGERERWARHFKELQTNFVLCDMTGNDRKFQSRGMGYVPEIVNIIQRTIDNWKCPAHVGGVVIDYAGACVRRHLMGSKLDPSANTLFFLTGMPQMVTNDIAIRFNCPVWLNHQLSGQANARSVTTKQDHTDASGSKSFAENLDFCFTVGRMLKADHGQQLGVLSMTKHRRTPPRDSVVIKLTGALGRIEGTGKEYTIDPVTKHIITTKDGKRVAENLSPDQQAAKELAKHGRESETSKRSEQARSHRGASVAGNLWD